jgi:hypothetical protein
MFLVKIIQYCKQITYDFSKTPDLPVEEVALTVLVTGTCMPNGCDTTVSVWLLGWLVAGRGKGGG